MEKIGFSVILNSSRQNKIPKVSPSPQYAGGFAAGISVSARRIPPNVVVFKTVAKIAAPVGQAGEGEAGSAGAGFDGLLGTKRLIHHTAKSFHI